MDYSSPLIATPVKKVFSWVNPIETSKSGRKPCEARPVFLVLTGFARLANVSTGIAGEPHYSSLTAARAQAKDVNPLTHYQDQYTYCYDAMLTPSGHPRPNISSARASSSALQRPQTRWAYTEPAHTLCLLSTQLPHVCRTTYRPISWGLCSITTLQSTGVTRCTYIYIGFTHNPLHLAPPPPHTHIHPVRTNRTRWPARR